MIGVVVGNPRVGSRTLAVAAAVAGRLSHVLGEEVETFDLAVYGARLFDSGDVELRAVESRLLAATAVVVASPTHKASFTGILKLFLDRFAAGSFDGHLAIPVMTGVGPGHSLAVDVHLRPVLIELGASLPTRGLYLTEPQMSDVESAIDQWWGGAQALVARSRKGTGDG